MHRRHPDLLLRRIRRSIIREILANAHAVGSKSIDKWRVGRQRQQHIQRIVAERASIEAGHLKCGGCSKLVRQCVGTKPCSDQLPVFTRVRRQRKVVISETAIDFAKRSKSSDGIDALNCSFTS